MWTVRWRGSHWELEGERGPGWGFGVPRSTKVEALRAIRVEFERYDDIAALGLHTAVSVRIYRKDGRIQEERTYPRGADPRRSKG